MIIANSLQTKLENFLNNKIKSINLELKNGQTVILSEEKENSYEVSFQLTENLKIKQTFYNEYSNFNNKWKDEFIREHKKYQLESFVDSLESSILILIENIEELYENANNFLNSN